MADDISGIGKLLHLKQWWRDSVKHASTIGYHPNGEKSWLKVKTFLFEAATRIFSVKNMGQGIQEWTKSA